MLVLNLAPSDCSARSSFKIGSDCGLNGVAPAARASERSRRGV